MRELRGTLNLVSAGGRDLSPDEAIGLLAARRMHPGLCPHPKLPDDTRLWAQLQQVSGGTWGGCVYDVQRITEVIEAGIEALARAGRNDASRGEPSGVAFQTGYPVVRSPQDESIETEKKL
jgi:hypothetical protein